MTCGGIALIVLMFIGAGWLSDQVNSPWPLFGAGALLVLFIAWRIFELAQQGGPRMSMRRARRETRKWAAEYPELVYEKHMAIYPDGRGATVRIWRRPDGALRYEDVPDAGVVNNGHTADLWEAVRPSIDDEVDAVFLQNGYKLGSDGLMSRPGEYGYKD